MRIVLAIGRTGRVSMTFLKMVVWGRLWKTIGDDGEVDKVSVCHSIMVRTNSSHLLQLGSAQQKRRLTGFQHSFLYLLPTNQVDDTGKVSSSVSLHQTTLTPLLLQETPFRGFLPHRPRTHHLPRHAPISNHFRRLHITSTQIERKMRVCCG